MKLVMRAVLFAAALAMTGSAFAEQVVSLTIGNQGDSNYGSPLYVTPTDAAGGNTNAGPYPYTITNLNTAPALQDIPDSKPSNPGSTPYLGFCIALTEEIGYGSTNTFAVTDLETDLNAENSNKTVDGTSNTIMIGTLQAHNVLALMQDFKTANGGNITPQAGPTTQADALTIAIWDVLDAQLGKTLEVNTTGNISVSWDSTSAAVVLANSWLAYLSNTVDNTTMTAGLTGKSQYYDPNTVVYALSGVNYNPSNGDITPDEVQDQSVVIALGSSTRVATPEPSALVSLSSLGLLVTIAGGLVVTRKLRPSAAGLRN